MECLFSEKLSLSKCIYKQLIVKTECHECFFLTDQAVSLTENALGVKLG